LIGDGIDGTEFAKALVDRAGFGRYWVNSTNWRIQPNGGIATFKGSDTFQVTLRSATNSNSGLSAVEVKWQGTMVSWHIIDKNLRLKIMLRQNPHFDGHSFFTEAEWVGVLFRGGLGTEMEWLVSKLIALNSDKSGFTCKRLELPNNDHLFWRDRDHPLDELKFESGSNLDYPLGIMNLYYMNFANSSHYFESLDGSWRMHLPADEQADRNDYKIWAGTVDTWRKLRPHLQSLPTGELPSSGALSYAYSRSNVLIKPDVSVPKNVLAGFGPVQFAGEAGFGWD
jgi:hypothetical protein